MTDETNPPSSPRPTRSKDEILGILKGDIAPQVPAVPVEGPAAVPPPAAPAGSVAESHAVVWESDQVKEVLRGVFDPELHMNIVDLGLVYGVDVMGDRVLVRMTLTSPGCPYGPYLIHQVRDTVQTLKGITSADVEVVWDPPWGPNMMTEECRLELGFDI